MHLETLNIYSANNDMITIIKVFIFYRQILLQSVDRPIIMDTTKLLVSKFGLSESNILYPQFGKCLKRLYGYIRVGKSSLKSFGQYLEFMSIKLIKKLHSKNEFLFSVCRTIHVTCNISSYS
eukprot:399250_1